MGGMTSWQLRGPTGQHLTTSRMHSIPFLRILILEALNWFVKLSAYTMKASQLTAMEEAFLETKRVIDSNASTFSCHLLLVLIVSISLLPFGTEDMIYISTMRKIATISIQVSAVNAIGKSRAGLAQTCLRGSSSTSQDFWAEITILDSDNEFVRACDAVGSEDCVDVDLPVRSPMRDANRASGPRFGRSEEKSNSIDDKFKMEWWQVFGVTNNGTTKLTIWKT